jgi:hypothetical protein
MRTRKWAVIGNITPYDYVYSAISSFGMAAYDLLFLLREEGAYRQYKARVLPEGASLFWDALPIGAD